MNKRKGLLPDFVKSFEQQEKQEEKGNADVPD